jgi:hypothetical protein
VPGGGEWRGLGADHVDVIFAFFGSRGICRPVGRESLSEGFAKLRRSDSDFALSLPGHVRHAHLEYEKREASAMRSRQRCEFVNIIYICRRTAITKV